MGLFNILKGEQPVSTFISMVAHRESLDLGIPVNTFAPMRSRGLALQNEGGYIEI